MEMSLLCWKAVEIRGKMDRFKWVARVMRGSSSAFFWQFAGGLWRTEGKSRRETKRKPLSIEELEHCDINRVDDLRHRACPGDLTIFKR